MGSNNSLWIFWWFQVQSHLQVRKIRNTYWNLTLVFYWIGWVYTCGLNKVFSSRFCVFSWVRQKTPEEGWRAYRLKHCEYSNNTNRIVRIFIVMKIIKLYLWNVDKFEGYFFKFISHNYYVVRMLCHVFFLYGTCKRRLSSSLHADRIESVCGYLEKACL